MIIKKLMTDFTFHCEYCGCHITSIRSLHILSLCSISELTNKYLHSENYHKENSNFLLLKLFVWVGLLEDLLE